MRAQLLFPILLAGCLAGQAPVDENDQAIIGGTVDTLDPSVVMLFAQVPGANTGSLCTAEIISPHVVLTAAHCVSDQEVPAGAKFIVYIGNDFNQTVQQSQVLQVKEVHANPLWSKNNLGAGHDVGVIILQNATTLKALPFMRQSMTTNMM